MRLLLISFTILALLGGAIVVGPNFVDWNKYKAQIITQIEKATGLQVTIDGDLELNILPSPHVTVNDLAIAAPKKKSFENILSMKSADISVALMPLLDKQVKVNSVKFVKPLIQIEMMADGTPSWTIDKKTTEPTTTRKVEEAVSAAPEEMVEGATKQKNDALNSVSLDRLEIEDGTFAYIDHRTGAKHKAEDVNIVLKADSLRGPFDLDGEFVADGVNIALNGAMDELPSNNDPIKFVAELALPKADASTSFNGVVVIKEPYEAQGKATININSPAKLANIFGTQTAYNDAVKLDGLLTADQTKIQVDDLKLALGDFVGNGKISVQNLKEKNPLILNGDIQSSSVLNLNKFIIEGNKKPKSSGDDLKNSGATTTASSQKPLIPQTITVPMAVNTNLQFDVGGVKYQDYNLKGVFLDMKKTGSVTKMAFKALELPGQAKATGELNINYASSSISPKTGEVTYSDPTVSYDVDGQIGQLATFLKAVAPDANTSAVTKLYKTAQFDLTGKVSGQSVSLQDSTLKLDDMVLGLGGSYTPATSSRRAKATIDLTAGTVDFDKIKAAQGSGAAKPANDNAAKGNAKEALKPVQNFSMPLDLTFDVSMQKARINGADLEGLRVTGSSVGQQLTLTNASVNNFAGANISVKGQVANLGDLSGLDLSLYTKTENLPALMSALKQDASKLPAGLKALEATVKGKGSVKSLGFDSNIKAMGGQLDVAGNAADLLGTPSYNNLSVGLKHPNFVKAIQVVSPDFKGQAGLAQPINLQTQANIEGKKISLSSLNATLGSSNFSGNISADASGKITSVRGNIQAGEIALDELLGAKKSSGSSSGGSSSGGSSSGGSSGKWSTVPINLSWMNAMDIDVGLSAASLTYGAWNFTKPSTQLKIANGQMNINGMKAGVFGGSATLTTQVKASPVSLSVSSDMSNIDLEKLARALSGGNKLKSTGTVSFNMDIASSGSSAFALVSALNGKAGLDGSNVVLKGFDLAKLARGLALDEKLATSAVSLIEGATSGGQTQFDTIKGDYKIQNGIVSITKMEMDGPAATIVSTGSADLPKWFINVDNAITLKDVDDLKPINVKIKGPLDNPSDTFGKNILEDYIQDKIRRKIGKELPGILGEDTTKKLQQFGILPKQQAPAPAPVETAPAEAAPTQEAPAQQVAPEPAPEPKKIEKPEDAVNEILNSDNPEEAINNVIKGLF